MAPETAVPGAGGAQAALLGELDLAGGVVVAEAEVRSGQLLVGVGDIAVGVALQDGDPPLGRDVRGEGGVGQPVQLDLGGHDLRPHPQKFDLGAA